MAFKDLFWWLEGPQKIVWTPFWWIILIAVLFSIPGFWIWWWLFVPFILMVRLQSLYLWWLGWDFWYGKQKWAVLEVVPPKEILAPLTAMEDVFSVVWTLGDRANWREVWCEGELPKFPYWFSWEIVSVEGKVHFYLRFLAEHRHLIESILYSHYPEIEITKVQDYTKNIPQNIPNEEWDFYGEDYKLGRKDFFPIKTYSKFFEPQGERISQEEKRIDPIVSLLEGMARLGPGEQAWLQIITVPLLDEEIPWRDEAKKEIAKIARRKEKSKKTILEIILDELAIMLHFMFSGKPEEYEESLEKALSPAVSDLGEREMLITPGEREILTAIEEKIKKVAYKVNIRGLYIAKRNAWKGAHGKIIRSYFPHFATANLNHFRFSTKTRTKVNFFMRERLKYYRQKRMFMNYVLRFPPLYPTLVGEANPILNAEELATIFHFPTRLTGAIAPTTERVEAKKAGPPANLPVEE
jgi:hypothetical protein